MKIYNAQANGDIQPIESEGSFAQQITVTEDVTIESVQSFLSVNVAEDGVKVHLPLITEHNIGMEILVRSVGADGTIGINLRPDDEQLIIGGTAVGQYNESNVTIDAADVKRNDFIKLVAISPNIGEDKGVWAITGSQFSTSSGPA